MHMYLLSPSMRTPPEMTMTSPLSYAAHLIVGSFVSRPQLRRPFGVAYKLGASWTGWNPVVIFFNQLGQMSDYYSTQPIQLTAVQTVRNRGHGRCSRKRAWNTLCSGDPVVVTPTIYIRYITRFSKYLRYLIYVINWYVAFNIRIPTSMLFAATYS